QIAFSIKPEFSALAHRHGPTVAERIYREGVDAVAELRALAHTPGCDVDWRDAGCFYGAHTPRHFDQLRRAVDVQPAAFGLAIRVVPRHEQATEIGSSFYHGGLVYEDDA